MKRVIIFLLFLHMEIASYGQTSSYMDLYRPARKEYVKGIVMTGVGGTVFINSVLAQYGLYCESPYVFELMRGERPYEDWMNRHAEGGMHVLAGFATTGLIISFLGVFHMVRGGNRMKKIANTYFPSYSFDVSFVPTGINLSLSF